MGFLENKRAMLLKGDCSDRLKDLPDESVDLVFTSPPYADRREHDYSTASEKLYVEWFLPIADQLFRVLKPTGSFVLNIKEGTKDNMKMAYVYELLLALRGRGWLWTEEYIWHKTTPYPSVHDKRFKNAYERLYHLVKNMNFKFNREAMFVRKTEYELNLDRRMAKLEAQKSAATNSGFMTGKQHEWMKKEYRAPTNVLLGPSETGNRKHSAVFPYWLSAWFVELTTNKGDVVLDPFMGSGTTALAALDAGRKAVGVELDDGYYQLCKSNLDRRLSGTSSRDIMNEHKRKKDKRAPKRVLGV